MNLASPFTFLGTDLHSTILPGALNAMVYIAPLILAVILWDIFWHLWMRYIKSDFTINQKYALLELRLPKETFKSPLAMETFLTALHNTSDGGWVARFWKGELRPQYSLEMISIEGQVKFFVWTEDKRKGGVMSALYSQYPGIEIYEREDYAKNIHFDPKIWKIWAAEFIFTAKDIHGKMNNALPIKTYVDYGLDKDPKEEFKVDPLVPVLEHLGSVGPNQQVWFQYIIRAHKKEQKKLGTLFGKHDAWKTQATETINDILKRDPKTKVSGEANAETGFSKMPTITEGEKDVVNAIERSLTKFSFDVGIRTIYIAKKDTFNTPFGIGGCISSMKQFSTEHLNGLKPNGDKWMVQFDEPWKDYKDMRRNYLSKAVLKAYRRRCYFQPPFESTPLVMNAEELATMFHLPGPVAATPGIDRVPSKKAEAPANLPI